MQMSYAERAWLSQQALLELIYVPESGEMLLEPALLVAVED